MPEEISVKQVMLLEYETLKAEQLARIGFRDNLLYATLAVIAAIAAGAVQAPGHREVLLLLPVGAVLLGWTYVVNDQKISAIGRYVRDELTPHLIGQDPSAGPAFGWERAHRGDARRVSRKYIQLGVDELAFVLVPLAAVAAYCADGATRPPLLALAALEVVALAVLAHQIAVYADTRRS